MNLFHRLFKYTDQNMSYYNFFYFRKSPRGHAKFGITIIPWQRLRMQQQGTDEVIKFDHLWYLRAPTKTDLKNFEKQLKNFYAKTCLFSKTKAAGHTEWFTDINPIGFQKKFKEFSELHGIKAIKLKAPYTATRFSECPYNSPAHSYLYESWQKEFWNELSKNTSK